MDLYQKLIHVLKFLLDNRRGLPYALLTITIILSTYLLSVPSFPDKTSYREGDIAKSTVKVNRDIIYIDHQELAHLKEATYNKQKFIFDRDYHKLVQIVDRITNELRGIEGLPVNLQGVLQAKKKSQFLRKARTTIPHNDVLTLLQYRNKTTLRKWATKYATLIFDTYGILEEDLSSKLFIKMKNVGAEVETVHYGSGNSQRSPWNMDHVISRSKMFYYPYYGNLMSLKKKVDTKFPNRIPSVAKRIISRRILQLYSHRPFLTYNVTQTEKLRKAAVSKIRLEEKIIKKGTILLREGEPVDSDTLYKIQLVNKYHNQFSLKYILGTFIIQSIILLSLLFILLNIKEAKHKFKESNNAVLLFSILIAYMLYSFFLSRLSLDELMLALLLPSGMIGMLGSVVLGNYITIIMGFYFSIFIFLMHEQSLMSFLISFMSILSGIYAITLLEKRTQLIYSSAVIGLSISVIIIGLRLTDQLFILQDNMLFVFFAFLNGFFCVMFFSSILPLYEATFDITTKFRLLEYLDHDNFLIRKVAMETPATYTHTLMVMALSEKAVRAINGDVLLTRVGCLYHDIGKTSTPMFFAENRYSEEVNEAFQTMGPYQSAKIVIDHVTDGIRLAHEHKLPQAIINFIPEHHGTTTIQYFYHQALEEVAPKRSRKKKIQDPIEKVDKKLFQYPGPKPQTRETAVVMLADSIEAAARSIEFPSEANFIVMIDKIIEYKLMEKQFDECDLTFSDLRHARQAFIEVLLTISHTRPKYPDMVKMQKLEKTMAKNFEV